jgi:hypothetical protein
VTHVLARQAALHNNLPRKHETLMRKLE